MTLIFKHSKTLCCQILILKDYIISLCAQNNGHLNKKSAIEHHRSTAESDFFQFFVQFHEDVSSRLCLTLKEKEFTCEVQAAMRAPPSIRMR
jgi:hypothetical protein